MKQYTKKAIYDHLKKYDGASREHDFVEVTEWKNGEGFDVEVVSLLPARFQLTYGTFDAIKKLVKRLEKG